MPQFLCYYKKGSKNFYQTITHLTNYLFFYNIVILYFHITKKGSRINAC